MPVNAIVIDPDSGELAIFRLNGLMFAKVRRN